MDSRFLRWMVLGFTCLWFGVLVPVHQRGQIQLPGRAPTAGTPPAHCSKMAAGSACHKQPAPQEDAPASTGNCAVCHYILGIHTPPPVTTYVARLGLTNDAPAEVRVVVPLRHAAMPFFGLDPPAA